MRCELRRREGAERGEELARERDNGAGGLHLRVERGKRLASALLRLEALHKRLEPRQPRRLTRPAVAVARAHVTASTVT